jgi:hypothetical protein
LGKIWKAGRFFAKKFFQHLFVSGVMTKKHERRPPTATPPTHRLGDRPSFISPRMHLILQVILVFSGVAFLRWLAWNRTAIDPQMKSDLPNANYSEFNPVSD